MWTEIQAARLRRQTAKPCRAQSRMKARPGAAVTVASVLAARSHYEVLGLKRGARKVGAAYKRACLKVHPDKVEHARAEEAFRKVHEAYQTLTDPDKRAAYDERLKRPAAPDAAQWHDARTASRARAASAMAQQSRSRPMSDAEKLRENARERYRRVQASREKARVAAMRREAERQERHAKARDRLDKERLARQQQAQEVMEREALRASQRAQRRTASMNFLERMQSPVFLHVPLKQSARGNDSSRPSRRGRRAQHSPPSSQRSPTRSARRTGQSSTRNSETGTYIPSSPSATPQMQQSPSRMSPPPASDRSTSVAGSISSRRLKRQMERVRARSWPSWF